MRRTSLGTVCAALLLAIAALAASPASALAQNAVLRGSVRSDGGEAIAGANVYIIELNAQAATNEAGRFVITVAGDRVRGQQVQLRVRAIGYRPSSRSVTVSAGEQSVDFTLATDINRLEEIVVTGVLEGTERTKVPFTVSTVDMADVPVPATDPIRLLAGRVPGANVTSASGRPGSSASVILRGPTSINASGRGQAPLYIVDGVILNGALPDINPADIENVEVVKGAAAASLYGARAGNGVIQITTRSGRRAADGLSFNVRAEVGAQDIEGDIGIARSTTLLMDETGTRFCANRTGAMLCANTIDWATEAARVNNQAGDFAGAPVTFPLDPGASTAAGALRNAYQTRLWPGRTYNAVEQAVEPGEFVNTTVDMTARFSNTQVYASVSGLDQGGAFRYLKGYERYSARLNADQRLGDAWSLAIRTYYARAWEDGFNQETGNNDAFFRLTRQPGAADLLATDTLGRIYIRTNLQSAGSQNQNPLTGFLLRTASGTTDRFLGGATLQYTPAQWLDLEGNFSYDYAGFSQQNFNDKGFRTTTSQPATNAGFIFRYGNRAQSFNSSLNAILRHNFGRNVAARGSLRYLYEQQDYEEFSGQGNQLAAAGVPTLNNATGGSTGTERFVNSYQSSVRQIGMFAGAGLEFFGGRYVLDGLIRRDGSSLFGEDERWATFGRVSAAWNIALEPWWFAPNSISAMKLRASRGSAGGRPPFSAQYETYSVSSAGVSFGVAGNSAIKPEITTDNEIGADIELFRRALVTVTYASSQTTDQILQVPVAAEKGFSSQWRNAGTLESKVWELSLNLPVWRTRDINWTWTATYDQVRTTITELFVPPFNFGGTSQATTTMYRAQVGERYGTFYGREFVTSCSQLPPAFQADCGGETTSFQRNDDGYIVWVGQGNSWREGITRNLYQTSLPSASAPWGTPMNFGMPIVIRDTTCLTTPSANCPAAQRPLGNGLPDWQFSIGQTFQYRRLTIYGLLHGVMGREVWNQGYHWAHLDFMVEDVDQRSRTVETAKPLGYYWRASSVDGAAGIGGFYDLLGPNNYQVEDASYMKLRELSVAYNIGAVGGVGNWTASVIGRNLFTFSDYRGFDPEVGQGGGFASSAAINAVDAFAFPNARTFTFALSTSF